MHFHVLSNGEMFTTNRDISHYTLMDAYLTQTQLHYRPLAEMDSEMQFSKFMMIDNPLRLNEAAGISRRSPLTAIIFCGQRRILWRSLPKTPRRDRPLR